MTSPPEEVPEHDGAPEQRAAELLAAMGLVLDTRAVRADPEEDQPGHAD